MDELTLIFCGKLAILHLFMHGLVFGCLLLAVYLVFFVSCPSSFVLGTKGAPHKFSPL